MKREKRLRLPVLLYSHIGDSYGHADAAISPTRFALQMQWLSSRGYTAIRPSEWVAWLHGRATMPRKPVLLTFDQAYAEIARYALPAVRQWMWTAAVFVVTRSIGGRSLWDDAEIMTADEIRRWAAEGIEFGVRTPAHPDLTLCEERMVEKELAASATELSEVVGTRVVSLAYDNGNHNGVLHRCAGRLFEAAFTTDEGLNDVSTPPHLLRRTRVLPRDTFPELDMRLHLGWNPVEHLSRHLHRWLPWQKRDDFVRNSRSPNQS